MSPITEILFSAWFFNLSYSLNSLKRGYIGDCIVVYDRGFLRVTLGVWTIAHTPFSPSLNKP